MAAPIIKYQNILVRINVPNPPTKIFFPDQPNLRESRVTGIEAQDFQLLPITSDLNTPNVPLDVFRNTFLTLVVDDVNNVVRFPIINLQTVFNNIVAAPAGQAQLNNRDFSGLKIYWNKCFIEFPAALAGLIGANCSYNFGVYYSDPVKPNQI